MVGAALGVWRPEDWGGLWNRKPLTWAMQEEAGGGLIWKIVGINVFRDSKQYIKECRSWELWVCSQRARGS